MASNKKKLKKKFDPSKWLFYLIECPNPRCNFSYLKSVDTIIRQHTMQCGKCGTVIDMVENATPMGV